MLVKLFPGGWVDPTLVRRVLWYEEYNPDNKPASFSVSITCRAGDAMSVGFSTRDAATKAADKFGEMINKALAPEEEVNSVADDNGTLKIYVGSEYRGTITPVGTDYYASRSSLDTFWYIFSSIHGATAWLTSDDPPPQTEPQTNPFE